MIAAARPNGETSERAWTKPQGPSPDHQGVLDGRNRSNHKRVNDPMGHALTMTGKLDEISFALGELKAQGLALLRTIEENRRVADRRHSENREQLESIDGRVDKVENAVATMSKTVGKMEPVVEGIQIARWKVAGALGVAFVILSAFGWIVSRFAGFAATWIASHFIK